ncbi:hydroxymethylbilane synthase [Peptococcaceae bacterium]|nr:hydroxymethylbilane synthase [Peptococcaceae bacterium]
MWQTNWVVEQLKEKHPEIKVEIVKIKTKGDKILDTALSKIDDKGLFTKELELAMLRDEIDIAVHSMKDMPTKLVKGLIIGAICKREHPGDVLVSSTGESLDELKTGAVIGTSSLRRRAQLMRYRPDLNIVPIRGNLNTRIDKLKISGNFDAIVVAAAGVIRLGRKELIDQYIPPQICLPAVGQGAVGIEVREGDKKVMDIIKKIEHRDTALAVSAERALLERLEGGCQVPIGAFGVAVDRMLRLEAAVLSTDGKEMVRLDYTGDAKYPEEVGVRLAEELLERGAYEILSKIKGDMH